MKYAVILCDGMADLPTPELSGKTPMECAKKPNMDALAAKGEVGMVRTVAAGLKPGSDVANMSVMGYDPAIYHTGRSPLEAASMGLELADDDVAIRCNLVTLSEEEDYAAKTMVDYCAGDISTAEAAELIAAVQEALGSEVYEFNAGISYRHCLVWHGGKVACGDFTPPHDISGRVVGEYLNDNPDAAQLIGLMKRSVEVLTNHPVNKKRVAEGKRPANSIWLWGQGSRPKLDAFEEKFGLSATVISAVDLIRGIAKCASMNVVEVEGATGYIDTNFAGKTQAGIDALLGGSDLVYMHFEAPDECGHRHEVENKVRSIEMIDSLVLRPFMDALDAAGEDYRILILPDHPTPLVTMTHSGEPVPYLIYDSRAEKASGVDCWTEAQATATGVYMDIGHELMSRLIEG
ncbi:MAG: cofactor-independent phosphoglycerate mutase [Clostridia bacterium]|nr:cofactor-independent phosphoglycerate mutase [Clostridia bacterium]